MTRCRGSQRRASDDELILDHKRECVSERKRVGGRSGGVR